VKPHPAQRFIAPSSIQPGVPLKELMGRKLVALIGESLAEVLPEFDVKRFQARACRGLDKLELKGGASIAHAMAQLPADFMSDSAAYQSFGPTPSNRGNGWLRSSTSSHPSDRRLWRLEV
jgi:hypothetical protein